jgi:hypothetical protein
VAGWLALVPAGRQKIDGFCCQLVIECELICAAAALYIVEE